MKEKKISPPFMLIECYAQCWSQEYQGQTYEKTGRDFRAAKDYLELNDGFSPDNITAKAKIFLRRGGYFAEENVRHNFTSFINNISTCVEKSREIRTGAVEDWTCPECGQVIWVSRKSEHHCILKKMGNE